ncbi:MAG: hypothetical protein ACXW1D_00365 [Halobacteriota archaeon]
MNNYKNKSFAELQYIMKDASEAAKCAQELGNAAAESKYLDQVNDAATELYKRRKAN